MRKLILFLIAVIEVYFSAMLLSSPVVIIAVGILQLFNVTVTMLHGNILFIWLVSGAVFSIPLFIYVLIKRGKTGKNRKAKKQEAKL